MSEKTEAVRGGGPVDDTITGLSVEDVEALEEGAAKLEEIRRRYAVLRQEPIVPTATLRWMIDVLDELVRRADTESPTIAPAPVQPDRDPGQETP